MIVAGPRAEHDVVRLEVGVHYSHDPQARQTCRQIQKKKMEINLIFIFPGIRFRLT